MSKKLGANREDISQITRLEYLGFSAAQISNRLHIVESVVLEFMFNMEPLDLDSDGKTDTEVLDDGGVRVTHDADGVNIDVDGDGIADVVIPKK